MNELKITNEILIKGAFIFAAADIIYVTLLIRIIKPDNFVNMKWRLTSVMGAFFFVLFGTIVSYIFWDSVYSFVFPFWFRWIIPPAYALLFALYGLLVWWLSVKTGKKMVLYFCLFGGLFGILTHTFAIFRGILEKPPMLTGANPYAALLIATFEFIFYWCVCLTIAYLTKQFRKRKYET
jgi:hypothetical protein